MQVVALIINFIKNIDKNTNKPLQQNISIIIPVFRSFYIKYGEKNTGSQFVTQYFLILFFA